MSELIEKIGYSVIHHAKQSARLNLVRLAKPDLHSIIPELKKVAETFEYGKILCKVPDWAKSHFLESGFNVEATIFGCYTRITDMHFLAFFPDKERGRITPESRQMIDGTIQLSRLAEENESVTPSESLRTRGLTLDEMDDLAQFNNEVFGDESMLGSDSEYLRNTHQNQLDYFGIYDGLRLVAAASVEIDELGANAELKDMATRDSYRGQGLSNLLLSSIEADLGSKGIHMIYSLARSLSTNHNCLFVVNKYKLAGTLYNDTFYQGANESMNVWYKSVEADESFGDTFGAMFRLEERGSGR